MSLPTSLPLLYLSSCQLATSVGSLSQSVYCTYSFLVWRDDSVPGSWLTALHSIYVTVCACNSQSWDYALT